MTVEDMASLVTNRRQVLGLSQAGLAAYVEGLDQRVISNWEQGEDLERHIRFLAVLEILGVELVCRPLRP